MTNETDRQIESGTRLPATIESIAIAEIDVGERLRAYRESLIPELAASIQAGGLIQPITVARTDDGYRLVAGRHRLEACRRLGWAEIPAIVVDPDQAAVQLAEIDENLHRAELSILERGEHLVRRSEVLEALGQRARSGRPKKGVAVTPFLATTADLAEAAGVSERTAQRYMQIARALPPAVRDVVRGASLADQPGELEDLAKIEDLDEQLAVARSIASGDLHLYYGIADARRRIDQVSRMCGTCHRIVDREHLIDGKVVHGIGCTRDDDPDDEDLEPLVDDEAIEATPMQPAAAAPSSPEPSAQARQRLERASINPNNLLPGQIVAPPRPPRRRPDLAGRVYAIVGSFYHVLAPELADELRTKPLRLDQEEVKKLCDHLEESSKVAKSLIAEIRAAAKRAASSDGGAE